MNEGNRWTRKSKGIRIICLLSQGETGREEDNQVSCLVKGTCRSRIRISLSEEVPSPFLQKPSRTICLQLVPQTTWQSRFCHQFFPSGPLIDQWLMWSDTRRGLGVLHLGSQWKFPSREIGDSWVDEYLLTRTTKVPQLLSLIFTLDRFLSGDCDGW